MVEKVTVEQIKREIDYRFPREHRTAKYEHDQALEETAVDIQALYAPFLAADEELGRCVAGLRREIERLRGDQEGDLASITDCVNTALRDCNRAWAQINQWTSGDIKGAIDHLVYENTLRRLEIARLKARVRELEAERLGIGRTPRPDTWSTLPRLDTMHSCGHLDISRDLAKAGAAVMKERDTLHIQLTAAEEEIAELRAWALPKYKDEKLALEQKLAEAERVISEVGRLTTPPALTPTREGGGDGQ